MHTLQESGLRRWVALQEGAGQSLGWLTTNERKESMCFQLRDALRVGNISLSSSFFSTTSTSGEALRQLDDELVCQSSDPLSLVAQPGVGTLAVFMNGWYLCRSATFASWWKHRGRRSAKSARHVCPPVAKLLHRAQIHKYTYRPATAPVRPRRLGEGGWAQRRHGDRAPVGHHRHPVCTLFISTIPTVPVISYSPTPFLPCNRTFYQSERYRMFRPTST